MILWIRTGLAVLVGLSLSGWMSLAGAKDKISARDVQTSCLVPEVPALEHISVTWTGDCAGGMATGVGSVFAFSRGELRYILRAQFIEGRLTRQDQFRLCSGTSCIDQVAAAVLREHEQIALSRGTKSANAAPAAAASVPALIAPASSAASGVVEIRAEDALYIGNFVVDRRTGKLSGSGRAEFFDGRVFVGQLENGLKVGKCTYVWTNGQRYVGNWSNDLQDGLGEWTTPQGDHYVGDFRSGNREGKGVMVYANKMEYSGAWIANQPSGIGTFRFPNGDVYEGQTVAGERTGKGTLTQKDGSRYTGQWRDGMRDGKGLAEWSNGQRYDGEWRHDRKEGTGSMRFPDGATYDGLWKNDRASGQARMEFASGDTYVGEVVDGISHGKGIYKWGSGDQFEGEFVAGKPTANGVMTFHIDATAATTADMEPEATPVAPAQPASNIAAGGTVVSKATLCARGYNGARTASAMRRFIEAFPEDECGRHSLARQKIAIFEEADRKRDKGLEERAAQARALVGMVVAYRQEYPSCASGSGSSCQTVVYYFEVKGKIKIVDLARESVQLQVMGVTLLGNEKGAPAELFTEGRTSAEATFRNRVMGTTQWKSKTDVGLAF